MTDKDSIEAQLAANNAEIAANKARLAASLTTWDAFLELPWPEQERLRELVPERVAQLEQKHFKSVAAPGRR